MKNILTIFIFLIAASSFAASVPKQMFGDWTLDIESDYDEAGWMRVEQVEGKPIIQMRVEVGNTGPYKDITVKDGRVSFPFRKARKNRQGQYIIPHAGNVATNESVEMWLKKGKLQGVIIREPIDGSPTIRLPFVGKKIPPMNAAPDLSKVRFGHPISLFNGKDLTGWSPRRPEKAFGWKVEDGLLVNVTPKTDFSATGAFANLRTDAVFDDFWLHIEFLIEADRNSGVYLRGMYEAQVVDRDSRMQGLQGVGAIFSKIAPSVNAGKVPGEWQTYDITLVDRHVTVVLNGVKVIDNQPVDGPTGGAMHTDPMAPGPIYLQGDHTSVKYKNIYLAPVIRD
ncbi:MAG: DUF1080 domain-containing protein [Puniceicoccaceae bacterium]